MKEMIISINYISDIKDFIAEAQKVDGAVLVRKGSYCVDGTSILGMLSLDTSQPIIVSYPEKASNFEKWISKFKVNR